MALRLYHDANATQEITDDSPDLVRRAVVAGQTLVDERPIYIKSDNTSLTYENVIIRGLGDTDNASQSGEVDVLYALDDNGQPGTYVQELNLPDQDYAMPFKVWRKIFSPNVQAAFKVTTIYHHLEWDEYVK